MASAIYIGAGHDVVPILLMPEVRKFIYIDSRPETAYGALIPVKAQFYDTLFLSRLEKALQSINFTLTRQLGNCLEYVNPSNQVLKYYINTTFPKDCNEEIISYLSKSENLVLCGYDPDKSILQLMPNLKYIWINTRTVYNMRDSDFENEKYRNMSTIRQLRDLPDAYKYRLMKEKDNYEICECTFPPGPAKPTNK
jgi:hypothetical protein